MISGCMKLHFRGTHMVPNGTHTVPKTPSHEVIMKTKKKLTKTVIDSLKPGQSRYVIWDTEIAGFGLRVETTGTKTFLLKYRTAGGVTRKPTIDKYGKVTLEQARKMALDWLHEVRHGGDPSRAKQTAREEKGTTINDVLETFQIEHVDSKKKNTRIQYEGLIKNEIKPAFGKRRVDEVTEADVSRLLHRVGKKYPIKANRLRAVMSKLFSFAERRGYRPRGSNPVTFIDRYREKKRHRDLNDKELKALANALNSMQDDTDNVAAIAAIRLMLFTGARRGEVLNLRWSEVDLDRAMLRLGDSKTGKKTVYLNSAARQILDGVEQLVGCPYVFPQQFRPKGRGWRPMPEWELREVWESIRSKAGLEGGEGVQAFRLHDLRHSFASLGAGEGLSLLQIGELLGHSPQSRTTGRYADLVNAPNVQAAEAIGKRIAKAMNAPDKEEAEVVTLHQGDDADNGA